MEELGILDPTSDADLFAIHYTFIPCINVQLVQFMNAWNNHPLRTEHGLSPIQLWQQGMLSAFPAWQQEILAGFRVPAHYGVDCNTTTSISHTFDQPSVIIPEIHLLFTTQQLMQLQALFSHFQTSDNAALDIYVNIRQYLVDILHV